MAKQPRAEVTRQVIMDAAVELFDEVGYGETTLTAIIERAETTKGAFYYRFADKEAVAGAIIDEGGVRVEEVTRRITDSLVGRAGETHPSHLRSRRPVHPRPNRPIRISTPAGPVPNQPGGFTKLRRANGPLRQGST